MGMNNRQRRAAKAKGRAKRRANGRHPEGSSEWTPSPEFLAGAAILALRQLVFRIADGHLLPRDVEQFASFSDDHQQAAIDDQLTAAVRALTAGGWTPLDIYEVARRKQPEPLVEYLLGTVAAETARYDAGAVHPAWLEQLRGVEPAHGCRRWARGQGLAWPDACRRLVELMALLFSLPKVEAVLPAPGSPGVRVSASGVDERMLQRVRALLAKAESTEFDEEADALTAKAQELMRTYSIERSLAEADTSRAAEPVVRRLWIDAPYVEGKAMLVDEVAAANRCRCILTKAWGFVTLVGFGPDLDTVELLVTSLLVQATRAMTLSGSQVTRHGTSRTRSFRQSFLVAYADRIGERLRETIATTESRVDHEHDGRLLPVLAARDHVVDDATARLFPDLVERSVRISNMAGWGAGRAAADLALFDIRDEIRGERAV